MRTHTFEMNGLRYTIEKSISGDCCRLLYGEILIRDDSACEDFYGDPEELVDIFKADIEEEASKRMPWWTLMDAIYEWGSDPKKIEDQEEAKSISGVIEDAIEFNCITDFDEIEDLKQRLDMSECVCKRLYTFVNGSSGTICLDEDWTY